MPWTASKAKEHTRKANTPAKKKRWASVANAVLKRTGDDAKAIRIANSVVKKTATLREGLLNMAKLGIFSEFLKNFDE